MAVIKNIIWETIIRPMRTTFATSLGSKTCATSVIVKVTCKDGSVGLGEIPTSFVLPKESVKAIQSVLTQVRPALVSKSADDYAVLTAQLRKQYPDFHMTISGLETAMFRAHRTSQGKPGSSFGAVIETDITIPFVPKISVIGPWIREAIGSGFYAYKIKVSGDVKKDLKFCLNVQKILSESGRPYTIRLDGNQGFTAKSAMKLLEQLDRASVIVELFEQPLKRNDYKGMKALYKQSPVPIIADETVFCADDCKRVIDDCLAHGVNIKIAKSGISQSQKILQLARRAKLKLMIGCMTETMVGLSAGIYLAAGTAVFDYIDLDSIHFLYHHNQYDNIRINGSQYIIGRKKKWCTKK